MGRHELFDRYVVESTNSKGIDRLISVTAVGSVAIYRTPDPSSHDRVTDPSEEARW